MQGVIKKHEIKKQNKTIFQDIYDIDEEFDKLEF